MKDKVTATVAKYLTNIKAILSIKETHKTNKLGQFIFIVYKQDCLQTRFRSCPSIYWKYLQGSVVPKIYLTEDKQDKYRVTYQSPSARRAVEANRKQLDNILLEEEMACGTPPLPLDPQHGLKGLHHK
jgi:hypothetical protein